VNITASTLKIAKVVETATGMARISPRVVVAKQGRINRKKKWCVHETNSALGV